MSTTRSISTTNNCNVGYLLNGMYSNVDSHIDRISLKASNDELDLSSSQSATVSLVHSKPSTQHIITPYSTSNLFCSNCSLVERQYHQKLVKSSSSSNINQIEINTINGSSGGLEKSRVSFPTLCNCDRIGNHATRKSGSNLIQVPLNAMVGSSSLPQQQPQQQQKSQAQIPIPYKLVPTITPTTITATTTSSSASSTSQKSLPSVTGNSVPLPPSTNHRAIVMSSQAKCSMEEKPKALVATPQQVMELYMNKLTPYEHHEIFKYPQIYFIGANAKKRPGLVGPNNSDYDNEHGSYIHIPHDHVAYRYEVLKIIGKGKMFKSAELPWLITFFQMFYNDKPVDWLLEHLIYTKVCNWEKDMKHCKQEKAKLWLHYKPSLFQHIGTTSSLKGKVQKLKDKQFGKIPAFYPHNNPAATVKTGITPYKGHTIQRAYLGESFFWGLLPQPGDLIEFIFNKPYNLRKYLFRSGNTEHPSDRFYNTTVEVLPESLPENSPIWSAFNSTADGFLIIGNFNALGIAEGSVEPQIGVMKEIRLHVHSDSENWAILSEIMFQDNMNR